MNLVVLILLIACFLFLSVGLLRMQTQSYQRTLLSWPDMSRRLVKINVEGITEIALDHLREEESSKVRTFEEVWELVGGADGLSGMRINCETFVAGFCRFQEEASSGETAHLTEQMQSDAEDLRRAILNFSLSRTTGYRKRRKTLYLRQAASAYYLVRKRFFSLYNRAEFPQDPIVTDIA